MQESVLILQHINNNNHLIMDFFVCDVQFSLYQVLNKISFYIMNNTVTFNPTTVHLESHCAVRPWYIYLVVSIEACLMS
jgi:hypothetical protein